MAQPLQYQSQFIPTNFGAVGQLTNFLAQDIAQRDKYFDAAAQAEASAIAELGALPTYDIEGRQQRIDAISKAMDEAVTKRGGDYGAAARDLSRIVAKERTNPFYQLNRQQQQAMEDYRKLSLNADNLVIGDPRMTIGEAQTAIAEGRNPFAVSALSKQDLYKRAGDIASSYGKAIMDPTSASYNPILGGQYFARIVQEGVRPENLQSFIEGPVGQDIMQSMLASYPELQGASQEQATEIIKQGLTKAIGDTDIKELANQDFMSAYQRARLAPEQKVQSGRRFLPGGTSFLVGDEKADNIIKSEFFAPEVDAVARKVAKKYGLDIQSYDEVDDNMIQRAWNWMKAGGLYKEGEDSPQQIAQQQNKVKKRIQEELKAEIEKLTTGDIGLDMNRPNALFSNESKESGQFNRDMDNMNTTLNNNIEEFKPTDRKSEKNFEDMEKDKGYFIEKLGFDGLAGEGRGRGVILIVKGKNKKDENITAQMYLPKAKGMDMFSIENMLMTPLINDNPEYEEIYNHYLDNINGTR